MSYQIVPNNRTWVRATAPFKVFAVAYTAGKALSHERVFAGASSITLIIYSLSGKSAPSRQRRRNIESLWPSMAGKSLVILMKFGDIRVGK